MEKNTIEAQPKKRKYLNEIIFLRSIACLCVAIEHALHVAHTSHTFTNSLYDTIVESGYVLLTFGTPTFIFISMLLISYSYPAGLPKDFLSRRFKLILFPFIFMAIFYSADMNLLNQLLAGNTTEVFSIRTLTTISTNTIGNLMGGYHGYFILIIFQFYILAYFFHKFLSKSNPRTIILISLVINLLYLAIFNFTEPPNDSERMSYFWKSGHWIPFIGWIFYFSLAFYCGLYYHHFITILKKHKKTIILSTLVFAFLTVWLTILKWIPLSSKSVTMLFFTAGMIGTLYLLATKIKIMPKILIDINNFSFSIYLLNTFYINITYTVLRLLKLDFSIFNVLIYFIVSIMASMLTAYLLNLSPYGKYFVGRVNVVKTETKQVPHELPHRKISTTD